MAEYIDKEIMRGIIRDEEAKNGLKGCACIEMAMDRQPSADVVLVARCKDCMWWEKSENSCQGRCELLGTYPTSGWYCANGRRKEGAENV